MHFLDQAKIFVRSGTGGPGAVSFRREKFIEYGGPDGGNGGKGGDIVFEAVAGLNTLIDFRYTQHFRAQRGHGGSGSNRTGGGGDDLVIKVPVGTQVLSEDKEEVLLDFTKVGQREVFLRAATAGAAMRATRPRPTARRASTAPAGRARRLGVAAAEAARRCRAGGAAQRRQVHLHQRRHQRAGEGRRLCLHHDPPAAGRGAPPQPRIRRRRHPGLIEGAADGAGIGDRFLGHIERCRVLLHLVDANDADVAESYRIVRDELEAYGGGLIDKPHVIALNKIDMLDDELIEALSAELAEASGADVIPLSGAAGTGVDWVLDRLLDSIGPGPEAVPDSDEGEDEISWSPL